MTKARKSGETFTQTEPGKNWLRFCEEYNEEVADAIKQFVEIESPSTTKQAVNRLGTIVASRFEELGGKTKFHLAEEFGNHLQVNFAGDATRKPVLLLGHMDTVYPIGTISKMPCRVADGKLTGPGALDMKSGIAIMLSALAALRSGGQNLPRPVTVLLVSDEEVGSDSSRAITERLAKESAAVLVLEPAYGPSGALKTARKGIGEYTIKVTGRAAHSGLDFEKGQSAILELARQIERLSSLVNLNRGVTLNVGLIQGGTRVNVVPAEARAQLDIRVFTSKDAIAIDKRLRGLKPVNRQCKIEVTGGINRPPMERTKAIAGLYAQARNMAAHLGWKLEESAVGGGSDGNFTAALGIPTLDGLGGVGEGAHASHEYVILSELPKRAALLAALIVSIESVFD